MYAGPIVKTYYSVDQYQRDTPLMAYYGYQPMNIQQRNVTNGLVLTLILLLGILLLPLCIGVVILCFLPFAFSKEYDVSYIQQRALGPVPQQYMMPNPYAPPQMMPSHPMPPYSQPFAPPTPSTSPPSGYVPAAPPPRNDVSFGTRVREGFASATEAFSSWALWQQVLVVTSAVLVVMAGVFLLILVAGALLTPH